MTHPLMRTDFDKNKVIEITRRLDMIFESEDVSEKYAEMLDAVLVPESFELGMSIFETELIRYSFPLLLERIAEKNLQSAANLLYTVENMVNSVSIPEADKDFYETRVADEIKYLPAESLFAAFTLNLPEEIRESVVSAVGVLAGKKMVNTALTYGGFVELASDLFKGKTLVPEKTLAEKISDILNDENLPAEFAKAIGTVIDETSLPQAERDSPSYIQKVLEALKDEESPLDLSEVPTPKGGESLSIGDCYEILLNCRHLPEKVRAAITAEIADEEPLDLSEVEAPKDGECVDLAKSLSEVLRHPKCPEKLHEVITDEIGIFEQPKDFFTSAEYLARVLCANDEVSE